jgi:WD40 repeat protein
VFEISSGKELVHERTENTFGIVAFSPDSQYVATVISVVAKPGSIAKNVVQIFELPAGKTVSRIESPTPVRTLALSPTARYLALGTETEGESPEVVVYNTSSTDQVTKVPVSTVAATLAFGADGAYLAVGLEGAINIFDVKAQKTLTQFAQDGTTKALAFSPDGQYLATGNNDRTARVFSLATRKEVSRLIHGGAVNTVGFSQDSKYVATGSADHMARMFEAATGVELSRANLDWPVQAVTFSRDQQHITAAAALNNGSSVSVTRHSLRPADLISDACSRVTRNLTQEEWKQYVGTNIEYHKTCARF